MDIDELNKKKEVLEKYISTPLDLTDLDGILQIHSLMAKNAMEGAGFYKAKLEKEKFILEQLKGTKRFELKEAYAEAGEKLTITDLDQRLNLDNDITEQMKRVMKLAERYEAWNIIAKSITIKDSSIRHAAALFASNYWTIDEIKKPRLDQDYYQHIEKSKTSKKWKKAKKK